MPADILPLAALLLTVSVAVAALFAALAPDPYMDEPFHVPQAQRYCEGQWQEWDPKITTFPGLYVLGAALGHAVGAAQRLLGGNQAVQPCSTTVLRATNLLVAAACLPLFLAAARLLDPTRTGQQIALMAAACFLFPPHFFFSFLYYTDVPSLFFTLAAHLACRQKSYRLAAALGAAAVMMRQTNAVWVAFCLAETVLDRCLPDSISSSSVHGSSGASSGRRREKQTGRSSPGMVAEVATVLRQAWRLKAQLAADLWPLAAVVAAFAAFVLANGGIVVGDKAHHVPVRHLAQPLYCPLYCTAWLAPVFWSPAALVAAMRQLAANSLRRPVAVISAVITAGASMVAAVWAGTLAHPFLLADNRHYAFYVWRRLINRSWWTRYAVIPAYLYSGWALQQRLAHRSPLWLLLLAGASCAVLVPAHLLEPRYFTIPFYLTFLHMRSPSTAALAAIVAGFAAVNAATIFLFLAAPFAWPDGSVARFMW